MALASSSGTFSGNTVVSIKTGAGSVRGYFLDNTANASTATFYQFFDAASAASVTLGTTAPAFSLAVPGGQGANLYLVDGVEFFNGICVAQTTTRAGSTAPAANTTYTVWFL